MPDDTEDELDVTNESADMKVDDTILKLAEQYVGYENRAKQLNKDKAGVREQADKIGIPSLAWQMGVRMVKMMDVKERRDFERGFKRVTGVLSKSAETLFPDDIERQKKRASRKAEKATKAAAAAGKETPEQQVRRLAADTNSRSKPKDASTPKAPRKSRGTAAAETAEEISQRRVAQQALETENGDKATLQSPDRQETGDELIARVSAEKAAELEQRAGADILDSHIASMKSEAAEPPKSQSQIAAEAREAAKVP